VIGGLLASSCTAVAFCQIEISSILKDPGKLYILYKSNDEGKSVTATQLEDNYGINVIEEYKSFYLVKASDSQIQVLRAKEISSYPLLDNSIIVLNSIQFDSEMGEPELDPRLTINDNEEGYTYGYYIVQFIGPVKEEWKTEIEEKGVKIYDYIPENSFIVKMDNGLRDKLDSMRIVQWIGDFHPEYKLSNQLLNEIEGESATSTRLILTLVIHYDENLQITKENLEKLGCNVIKISETAWNKKLRIECSLSTIFEISKMNEVKWIEKWNEPRIFNEAARNVMGTDISWTSYPQGLYGQGQIIGVADTGLDTGNLDTLHQDFGNTGSSTNPMRVKQTYALGRADDWSDDDIYNWLYQSYVGGHGTHVVGSILGNGVESGADPVNKIYSNTLAGAAPNAELVFQSLMDSNGWLNGIPSDLNDLFIDPYNDGARIHTNSWGSDAEGQYTAYAEEADQFMWDHKDFLILFAAGNAGVDSEMDGEIDLDTIGSPGSAKNVIAVGAAENYRPSSNLNGRGYDFTWGDLDAQRGRMDYQANPIFSDHISDEPDGMAAFSSRGPTVDGRIKPDISAPGTNIISTKSSLVPADHLYWGPYDDDYAYAGGTSMATPLTAGSAAIVRQYFTDIEGISNPSAALIKATLINSAVDMNGQYTSGGSDPPNGATEDIPNFHEGWGRVDTAAAISTFPISYIDENSGLNTGESITYEFEATESSYFLATLLWTDYPGSTNGGKTLVNDLNLEVTAPDNTVYNGNDFTSPFNDQVDDTNNVEGIRLWGSPQGTYSIKITAQTVPEGPQPFALVIHGPGYFTSISDDNFEDNDDSPNASEIVENSYTDLQWFDDDWYKVYLNNGESISVTIQFIHSNGDLELILYDTDAFTVLDSSTGGGNSETVGTTVTASGYYYIYVYGFSSPHNEYDMSISITIGGNSDPFIPSNPSPSDMAQGLDPEIDLSWSGGDPDGDQITYDIHFGEAPSLDYITTVYQPFCELGTLGYGVQYNWRIIANDSYGGTSVGPIWTFTTNSRPNNPSNPNPADDSIDVAIDITLSWTGGDPDPGDTVSYDIYFGTTPSQGIEQLVYQGNTTATYNPGILNWGVRYYWKIIAIDNHGATNSVTNMVWDFTTMLNSSKPPGTQVLIGTNPGGENWPDIYGDIVVWSDYRNGNGDIYGYNLFNGTEFRITTNPDGQGGAAIYEDKVVYVDNRDFNTGGQRDNIYMTNLTTGTETTICTAWGDQWGPKIFGNYIVWYDYRNDPDGMMSGGPTSDENADIYMFDLGPDGTKGTPDDGGEIVVCSDPETQEVPDIHGNTIVWADYRDYVTSSWNIYKSTINPLIESPLVTQANNQNRPAIWYDKVVWEDFRNLFNYLIYEMNISTSVESIISDSNQYQQYSSIYGNKVVWSDFRGDGDMNIWFHNLETGDDWLISNKTLSQMRPNIYGNRIVWWDSNSEVWMHDFAPMVDSISIIPEEPVPWGEATFMIEFTEHMDTTVTPMVTFGITSPYQTNTLTEIGWDSSTIWKGQCYITPSTGNGLNNILVSGGKSQAGYIMSDDASNQFTIDATPPTVTSTDPTDTAIDVPLSTQVTINLNEEMNKTSAESAFYISDNINGTFQWTNGNSTLIFIPKNDLQYGKKYFISLDTRAKDLVGNHIQSAYHFQFTTIPDTTAPPAPSNVTAIPDDWTNINSFIINWTNPADDSGIKVGCWYKIGSPPTSDSDGTWQSSKPITVNSLEGEQTIYIWVEDKVGNKNYLSYGTTILYLDTVAPSTPSGFTATPDDWTNINSFVVDWENPMESGTSGIKTGVWYKIGSPPTSDTDGTWEPNKPITVNSIEGENDIFIWLEDIVGNINYLNYESSILYLDTTAPSPPTGLSATPDEWTNINSYVVDWLNPTESGTSGIKTGVWYKIGSPPTSDIDGTWGPNKPITVNSIDGENDIFIWLEDNIGNSNYLNYGSTKLYLDTTAPSAPSNIIATPNTWTNTNSYSIDWTNPSDISGIKTGAWYKIGNPPTSNSDGTWQNNKPITVTSLEGQQSIYIWLEDNTSNINYLNFETAILYLDTTAPLDPEEVSVTPDDWTNTNSFVVDWVNPTESDTSRIKTGIWYKIGSPPTSNSDGTWQSNKPITVNSNEGQHDIYVWLEDNVGNVNFLNNDTATLYLDTTPPTITHTQVTSSVENQDVTITATIEDDFNVENATLFYRKIGDTEFTSISLIKSQDTYSADIPSSAITLDGIEYYIEATDGMNTATNPVSNPITNPYEITVVSIPIPTGLIADSGDGEVTLSWNIIEGATGYNIYRSTSPDTGFSKLNIELITEITYTDTSVTNGEAYYYHVKTIKDGLESAPSDEVKGEPKSPSKPDGSGKGKSEENLGNLLIAILIPIIIIILIILLLLQRKRKETVVIKSTEPSTTQVEEKDNSQDIDDQMTNLEKLKEMKEKELITEEEYETKRKEIIDEI
jgi:beta propeller repeat protein